MSTECFVGDFFQLEREVRRISGTAELGGLHCVADQKVLYYLSGPHVFLFLWTQRSKSTGLNLKNVLKIFILDQNKYKRSYFEFALLLFALGCETCNQEPLLDSMSSINS